MKLCFPIETDKGLESTVYSHFGSAPFFLLFDTETNTSDIINNSDLGHGHGMCSPLKALNGKTVDAIVSGGIGAGAVSKLNSLQIKVYRAEENTVQKNIDLFKADSLPMISVEDACGHHGGCGGH